VNRRSASRWAGPVAFLVAITIAALLVRSAFNQGSAASNTVGTTTTHVQPAHHKTHKHAKKKKRSHTQTTAGGAQYYTVQSGDSFSLIASRLGTTSAALEQLNPGVDPSALHVGERIRVK
jgi:LysM repeat protein